MTAAVEIRPAGAVHAEVIAALIARCLPERWSAASVAGILTLPNARGWLACTGDEPVGYAIAQRAGDDVELQSIGVLPGWRGTGAGRALHGAVMKLAPGARRIVLEVAVDNEEGHAFYRALGYREAGRRRGYYRRRNGTADALVMELRLQRRRGPSSGFFQIK